MIYKKRLEKNPQPWSLKDDYSLTKHPFPFFFFLSSKVTRFFKVAK